jgi:hypothetical protein
MVGERSEEYIKNAFALTLIPKVARWRPSVGLKRRNRYSMTSGS